MEQIRIDNLKFSYPDGVQALNGVSLTVNRGEFLVLCGPSGCGKTTLLRLLKPALSPKGAISGEIFYENRPLSHLSPRQAAGDLGFVQQSPDNQLVTDKVWHELSFGPESLGLPPDVIRRRLAETTAFFGIGDLLERDVSSLSGGQKQLLNLAAVLATDPKVLILDEPTSQLDPTAASNFLESLVRVSRELGVTVILSEHRLELAFALCDRVVAMDGGQILATGTPAQVGQRLQELRHPMASTMPVPMEIYACVPNDLPCPVSTAQGRSWLAAYAKSHPLAPLPPAALPPQPEEAVLEARHLWFRYEKNAPWVVQDCSFRLHGGELVALLGQNGVGKSTLLSLLAGLKTPQRGNVECRAPLSFLPQNPQTLFIQDTLRADLGDVLVNTGLSPAEISTQVEKTAALCRLEGKLHRHPYDLSGGEQQRAALCKVLLTRPKILLLDEPTKGLDGGMKRLLAAILKELTAAGTAILMVSHDVEFCARYADRCAMFFQGSATNPAPVREFFLGNLFYTTAASRMSRGILDGAVTPEDVINSCGGAPLDLPEVPHDSVSPPPSGGGKPPKGHLWRRLLGWCSGFLALLSVTELMEIWSLPRGYGKYPKYALLLALLGLAIATYHKAAPQQAAKAEPPSPRSVLLCLASVAVMGATVWFGPKIITGSRSYYIISLLLVAEALLPFFLLLEGRKPKARELVTIASLCALAVAGRAAFFMLPQFKPVAALVILSAMALGGESGFLIGALSMLLSNMIYGQGSYTPWQMLAMGLTGLLAAVLYRCGLLGRNRAGLAIYGFISVVGVYGVLMNLQSALFYLGNPTWQGFWLYELAGLTGDLVHGAATAFFLWFAGLPILGKLERLNRKYQLFA